MKEQGGDVRNPQGSDVPVQEMASFQRSQLNENLLYALRSALIQLSLPEKSQQAMWFANGIISSYSDLNRKFHTPQHITQVLSPELQEIIKNKGELTYRQAQELVFAAYHDSEYHIDGCTDPEIRSVFGISFIKSAVQMALNIAIDDANWESAKFADIKNQIISNTPIKLEDLELVSKIFGLPGKNNEEIKFRDSPINEFLSACRFVYEMRELGVRDEVITAGIIHIDLTKPFEKGHVENLYARLFAIKDPLGMEESQLVQIINDGRNLGNRDLGNLWEERVWKRLEGDLLFDQEMKCRIDVGNPQHLYDHYSNFGGTSYLTIFAKNGAVVAPSIESTSGPNVKLAGDDPEFIRMSMQAVDNAAVTILVKLAMSAALADMNNKTNEKKVDVKHLVMIGLLTFIKSAMQEKPGYYEARALETLESLGGKVFKPQGMVLLTETTRYAANLVKNYGAEELHDIAEGRFAQAKQLEATPNKSIVGCGGYKSTLLAERAAKTDLSPKL